MATTTKLSPSDMIRVLTALTLCSPAQFMCLVKDSRRCIDCGEQYQFCTCITTESERIARLPVSVGVGDTQKERISDGL